METAISCKEYQEVKHFIPSAASIRGKDSSKDSNTNHLKKEDSSNKKNFDNKRKCRENYEGNGEKDGMT
ncbi:hypothetical protein H5410_000607 [Solanum commersonii]|uniref:Uncharacterized protein n=1 Tax=Solanum commersonii TaxID=4109 RepID=A0A9J6AX88_SOLCO|nr:hypothetical protein H5410_000607 [Solanum commersonii]